ncbi:MAG TPA: glycerophosphodiester phosphodiesterase family protein [Blastocatellia bacterium]|nr:glycerophosphodiester phosphodiesterase family protein [Blastocatellia bacterium]HMZ22921.1 glycerophosphodiester phosphodiesterase family protein [Blastocatellia bacterium]HNG29421.1 glycerophosphodiester phosphodiesterase family protein [Blastocatellia bacterium]
MSKYYRLVFLIVGIVFLAGVLVSAQPGRKKILVAHRGASAYAPEHTVSAYRLAIEQKADFVEQDLQITKDGVLVCLHDLTLERTTNVEELFPNRFRTDVTEDQPQTAAPSKHWYVSDFTLAEIKQLDAGSWFNEKFKGERIPTWQEAVDLVRGKAGLYPETKAPEVYGKRGFDMEKLLIESLKKNKLDRPNTDPKTPLVIQSFSAASLRKLRDTYKTKLRLTFLIHADPQGQWLTADGLKKVKTFADDLGPNKILLEREPKIVEWAHAAGLTLTPYTFRSANTGKFKDVREEMTHFLFQLGVDALFTDNPDQFPRQ